MNALDKEGLTAPYSPMLPHFTTLPVHCSYNMPLLYAADLLEAYMFLMVGRFITGSNVWDRYSLR